MQVCTMKEICGNGQIICQDGRFAGLSWTTVFSYYKSEDDVNNGCKGSIKLNVCDVIVHTKDRTRLDLIIPGEAHFYVKAATPQERQQWLVALSMCKACLTQDGRPINRPEGQATSDDLRSKRSELRLYCDLLMQQVHGVKQAILDKGQPDIEKLNEATSLMSATCDQFVATLEGCMAMAGNHVCYVTTGQQHVTDSALSPGSPTRTNPSKRPLSSSRQSSVERYPPPPNVRSSHVGHDRASRSQSEEEDGYNVHRRLAPLYVDPNLDPIAQYDIPGNLPHKNDRTISKTSTKDNNDQDEYYDVVDDEGPHESEQDIAVINTPHSNGIPAHWRTTTDRIHPTFFTSMKISFAEVPVHPDGGIPVLTFLEACTAVLPIFDKLSATAFAPVKMDIAGNVRKLRQKYTSDPKKFATLQDIVLHEVSLGQQSNTNSATEALLWLKRAVEFIQEFLSEVVTSDEDLTVGATNAYAKTLRPFHGWVVRGVFALAMKAVPYRKQFLEHLAAEEYDISNNDYIPQVLNDLQAYVSGIRRITGILRQFYCKNSLDCPDQV